MCISVLHIMEVYGLVYVISEWPFQYQPFVFRISMDLIYISVFTCYTYSYI